MVQPRERTDAEAVNVEKIHILTDWDVREPEEMETFIRLYLNLLVSQI